MRTKGFTLIELVIVIVILGILSIIAAPRFLNMSTDAKNTGLMSLEGAIESGLKLGLMKMTNAGLEKEPYASNQSDDERYPSMSLPFDGCEIGGSDRCVFSYGTPYEHNMLTKLVSNLGHGNGDEDWVLAISDEVGAVHITWSWNVTGRETDGAKDLKEDNCYLTYYSAQSLEQPARVTRTECL